MIRSLSAAEIAEAVRTRRVSVREVVDEHLLAIERLDPRLRAFVSIDPETARRAAEDLQERVDAGDPLSLPGVPLGVKDNICTLGLPTTCASRILEGYVSPYEATVVERARAAGMVVLGKTNLDEFGMGDSTEWSAFGPSLNPWDLERTPGGSSGGSAAAVAARMVPLALGSDTGGSVRMPAALCGIVGMKPTYGRCSRYGLVAYASSLDQVGVLGRSVADVALGLAAVSGPDRRDSTSSPAPPIDAQRLEPGPLRGRRLGLVREFLGEGIAPGVRVAVEEAVRRLGDEGATIEQVSLPSVEYAVSTYYIIAPAEASSNLARYDGVRFGPRVEGPGGHVELVARTRGRLFGREVKARIMIGTYVLSAGYYDRYYARAHRVRSRMIEEFARAFEKFDALIGPTCPVTAFRLGELLGDPLALKLLDQCTIPANMGGLPALSLPCGLADGLPVGLQLMGPPNADERILGLGRAIEAVLPPLPAPPHAA